MKTMVKLERKSKYEKPMIAVVGVSVESKLLAGSGVKSGMDSPNKGWGNAKESPSSLEDFDDVEKEEALSSLN